MLVLLAVCVRIVDCCGLFDLDFVRVAELDDVSDILSGELLLALEFVHVRKSRTCGHSRKFLLLRWW